VTDLCDAARISSTAIGWASSRLRITKLKMEPVVRPTLVFYPVLLLCLLF